MTVGVDLEHRLHTLTLKSDERPVVLVDRVPHEHLAALERLDQRPYLCLFTASLALERRDTRLHDRSRGDSREHAHKRP